MFWQFQVIREHDTEKSEDRWENYCSIAQDLETHQRGESSTQHTPHNRFLFLKITWLMIITEVITAANNSHHCCYSNAYQYARCFYQMIFCTPSCISTKKVKRFFCSTMWKPYKMTTINSFFLPRWGQLTQYLLSERNAMPYCIDQFYRSQTMDEFELIKMFAELMLSQTHYWLDGDSACPCRLSQTCKQAKGNLWMATYHLLSWLTPRYSTKYSHLKVQTEKRSYLKK